MKVKSILFLLTVFSLLYGSNSEKPNLKELQEAVNKMKEAYGIIENDSTKKEFDLQRNYSDKELQEKVKEMEKLLQTDPYLNK